MFAGEVDTVIEEEGFDDESARYMQTLLDAPVDAGAMAYLPPAEEVGVSANFDRLSEPNKVVWCKLVRICALT